MDLRITGGRARGRVLGEPVGKGVRPTSSRVREAFFSLVGHELTGHRFLDAFGGSGLMGLEAWSRGADVTVIERHANTFKAIKRRGVELGAVWDVRCGDALRMASSLGGFEVVFADPPYRLQPEPILRALVECVTHTLVYESKKETPMPDAVDTFVLVKRRNYGSTSLSVYQREED